MPFTNSISQFYQFLLERYPDILVATREHVTIAIVAVLLSTLVAVPVGIYLAKNRAKWLHSTVFSIANLFQTIPSLALLAILLPIVGIGTKPAIIALFLYALLPILRNTLAGFQSVDQSVIEAARGMGYSAAQRLFKIQLPLAFPYIMSGLRMTTVYIISWTTLAALIGAGGLGQLIVSGIGVNRKELIFAGAIAAILLTLLTDQLLGLIERKMFKRAKSA